MRIDPRSRGFSLLELMIVVVIIAIVSAIAIPSYQQYVLRSHRADAQADLLELAQWLERRFTVDNRYGDPADPPVMPFNRTPRTGNVRYNLALNLPAAREFTLTATPAAPQTNDRCGTMTINQQGATTAAQAGCW